MEIGSSNSSLLLQLSQALQSSKQQTVRQVQSVSADIEAAKTQVFERAVEQTASSAELKGRLIDVKV